METHQSFYQNEIRALELEIDDNDGTDFAPSAAYVAVKDAVTDMDVVSEQVALVDDNRVMTIIGTAVTATPGSYKVVWRLLRSSYTYYHITQLEVQEL